MTDRDYMLMAIEEMYKSIQEPRDDNSTSPKVGAIIIKSDGKIDRAHRGEIRNGDHAEFTLLEKKNRSEPLDGSTVFATLEPCAPGARNHPKLGCAERLVEARVKKVWIGIEDPDPRVDRKGIKYLQDNGIEIEMFEPDLQQKIREANWKFIEEAEERAKMAKEEKEKEKVKLTPKEDPEVKVDLSAFDQEAVIKFIDKAKLNVKLNSKEFKSTFHQLGLIELSNDKFHPTGIGLLLFGLNPEYTYQNALIRATYKSGDKGEDLLTVGGALVKQPHQIEEWYTKHIGKQIDRSQAERTTTYDYPLVVFREAITNAIVHRDYDIEGAPIYFEINDDAIIIKSPGAPVSPIKIEKLKNFNAPSLSRNPKIMYVFDQLELVEQRGFGFQTIKELPTKYGLPLPIVTFEDPYMVFTFPRSEEALKNLLASENVTLLNDEEFEGYKWIRINKEIASKDYAKEFDINRRTANRHLTRMLELELITTNGESNNSPKLRYLLKE